MGQYLGKVIGIDPSTCHDVAEMRYTDQVLAGMAFAAARSVKGPGSRIIWASPEALEQFAHLNSPVEYYVTQLNKFHWGTVFRPVGDSTRIGIIDLQTRDVKSLHAGGPNGTFIWLVKFRTGKWLPPNPSLVHRSSGSWTLRQLLVGCMDHCREFGQYVATTHNCGDFSYGLVQRMVMLAAAKDQTTHTSPLSRAAGDRPQLDDNETHRQRFFELDRTGSFAPPTIEELRAFAHAEGFCLLVAEAKENINERAARWLESPDVDWSTWDTVESSFHAFLVRPYSDE